MPRSRQKPASRDDAEDLFELDDLAQHGRRDLPAAEATADRFVDALEMGDELLCDPMVMVRELDAALRRWGKRACRAMVSWEPCLSLRAPLGASEVRVKKDLMHEFAHVAADFDGIARPHDEDWIDEVAAAIWLRRRAIRRALRLWGWDGPRLLHAFGEVPAEVIFRRVAVIGGGVAILRSRAVPRRVFAAEHLRVHDRAPAWEQRWMRAALGGAEQPGFFHEGLWSIDDPLEGRAGLILFPPDALESREEPREMG